MILFLTDCTKYFVVIFFGFLTQPYKLHPYVFFFKSESFIFIFLKKSSLEMIKRRRSSLIGSFTEKLN